jgi:hypothetical protein|tara:strand:+ start:8084 stop:8542 length:459 start_codon:yes stop_codon:yes gene_type:complete
MEKRIRYFGFDSEWVRVRHITPATMKPRHLIRINKNNELRFVVASRSLCTFDENVKLPRYIIDGDSTHKLFVERDFESGKGWATVLEENLTIGMLTTPKDGRKRAVRYDLEKITERDIRKMLMETKFYLQIIDVILPTFETKEQSNIAYEDA